jgi:H+/Cl- antiporter ClcA
MQVPEEKSAKRNNLVPRREGGFGDIEIAVLIPLVLVANTIVATIAWYVVGSLAGKSEMRQSQISRCSRPSARHLSILLLISFGVVLCAQLLARAYQPIVSLLVETLEQRFKRADTTSRD